MERKYRNNLVGTVARGLAALAVMAAMLGTPLATTMAAEPAAQHDQTNDPLEPVNRVIFQFNEIFRGLILGPVTELYRLVMPEPVQDGIANVLDNLRAPVVLANDVLQGEGGRAWQTVQRFAINTTVGVGGVFDPAASWGLAAHDEDFGQTLAVWGADDGPYLVLPLLGPSSPRDAVGRVVDLYLDPLTVWAANTDREVINYARFGATAIDTYGRVKDDLDKIRETSMDPYAAIRSMYRQKRRAEVLNGAAPASPAIPDFQYGRMGPEGEPDGEPALSQLPADGGAADTGIVHGGNMMRFLRIGGR